MNLILISLILLFNFGQVQNSTGTIEVIISEAESNEGVVQMAVFNEDKGWPESIDDAWKIYTLPIENGIAKKTITEVPSGNYAITVFHDHDEDEKIRKNKVGYPIDGFGFSNNPSLIFGVPSFEKCSQKVSAAKTTRFEIDLR